MMKKLLSALLAICMVLAVLPPLNAAATVEASGTCGANGDNVQWQLDWLSDESIGTMIFSGSGAIKDYDTTESPPEIPPWVTNSNIIYKTRRVIVDEGITRIGNISLRYFDQANIVYVPCSVTAIGNSSMPYPALKTVVFEDGSQLETIGNEAFYGCTNLASIDIPKGVTSIGEKAFSGCAALTEVVIPDGVTSLKDMTFYGCSSLKQVTLPAGLTSIGDYAFYNCPKDIEILFKGTKEQWDNVYIGRTQSNPDLTNVKFISSQSGINFLPGSGGSGSMDPVTAGDGEEVVLPECPFTAPTGTVFGGWNINGVIYPAGSKYTVNGNVTANAQWNPGGSCGSGSTTYWRVAGDTLYFSGTGEVPEYINEAQLQMPWRSYLTSDSIVKNVVIEEGVTGLGLLNLYWLNLDSITYPGSMKQVNNDPFLPGNNTAKRIILNSGVEIISAGAFSYFGDSVQEITIPATVKTVGNNVISAEATSLAVNFGGNQQEWRLLLGTTTNEALRNATVNFKDGSVKHQIKYLAGAGAGNDKIELVADNAVVTLPACTFTAPSRTHFGGWLASTDGKLYQPGANFGPAGQDVTFTAQWDNDPRVVTLSAGDAGGDTQQINTYANTDFILPECPFAAPVGMEFKAWRFGNEDHPAGSAVKIQENLTITATWQNKNCLITFDPSGGSGSMDPVRVKGNSLYTFPNCGFTPPENKIFYCWLVNGEEKGNYNTVTITDDITVYVKWQDLHTITFDADGGSGAMSAQVVDGGKYVLPDCTFTPPEGMNFSCWIVDGQEYAPGQEFTVNGPLTVTAKWESDQYIVYNPNGGKIKPGTSTQIKRPYYPSVKKYKLPDSTLFDPPDENATFKGWLVNGDECSSGEEIYITAPTTIYALWWRHSTVTFDPNGGTVNTSSNRVTAAKPYGKMPVPTNGDYEFTGWFTEKDGGYLVGEDDIVAQEQDHTLYAHWIKVGVKQLSYKFSNSASVFGYTKGSGNIPYYIYEKMFNDTSWARFGYNVMGDVWNGCCYGMATSATMLYMGDVKVQDFNSSAGKAWDLGVKDKNASLDITVQEFIEMMMVAQFDYGRAPEHRADNKLNELWNLVKDFQEGRGKPVEIIMRMKNGGHALIGYAAEEVSEREGRIYLYDCNSPGSPRYVSLYKDGNGVGDYVTWHYKSSYHFDRLSYTTYDEYYSVWQARPGAGGDGSSMTPSSKNLLVVNSGNIDVYGANGEKAAQVREGLLDNLSHEDITQFLALGGEETPSYEAGHDTAIWLPVGLYTVVNLEQNSGDFQAAMVHVNQSAKAVTAGDSVTFLVDDGLAAAEPVNYVSLGEADAGYEITLSSSMDVEYKETKLTGSGESQPVAFAQIDSQLHAQGVDLAAGSAKLSTRVDSKADDPDDTGWNLQTAAEAAGNVEQMPDTVSPSVPMRTVSFDPNGGSGRMEAYQVAGGSMVALPGCGFTAPSGKEFAGWAVGGQTGDLRQPGERFPAASLTVYAVWKDASPSGGGNWGGIYRPSPAPTASSSAEPSGAPGGEPSASPDPPTSNQPDPTPDPTAEPAATPEPWRNPFPDVSESAWYMEAVEFVCTQGLMAGHANGSFGPGEGVTRAQFAQILYNKEGRPQAGDGIFSDIGPDGWYAGAVNWAGEAGIADGVGQGRFAPNEPLTREQMAVMLWRYAGKPMPQGGDPGFADGDKVSGYAREAIIWASEQGIINGKGGGILDPKGVAMRAEVAQMLKNYLG